MGKYYRRKSRRPKYNNKPRKYASYRKKRTMVPMIRKTIQSMAEKKRFLSSFNAVDNALQAFFNLDLTPRIPAGTGVQFRIGNRCRMTSSWCTFAINMFTEDANVDVMFRMIFYSPKDETNALATVPQTLLINGVDAPINIGEYLRNMNAATNKEAYIIRKDVFVKFGQSNGDMPTLHRRSFALPFMKGNISFTNDGDALYNEMNKRIYLCVLSTNGQVADRLAYNISINGRFIDI